jgi:hypothetical protein
LEGRREVWIMQGEVEAGRGRRLCPEGEARVVQGKSSKNSRKQHGGGGGRAGQSLQQGRKLVVGMKLTPSSRELLAWVIAKLAQSGDHILAVHVSAFSARHAGIYCVRVFFGVSFCFPFFQGKNKMKRNWGGGKKVASSSTRAGNLGIEEFGVERGRC